MLHARKLEAWGVVGLWDDLLSNTCSDTAYYLPGAQRIRRRRLCTIAVFNASAACNGQLSLQYFADKINKENEDLSLIGYLFSVCFKSLLFFALGTMTRAWMTTTVGTPMDVTDPGAIPPTQTHPGSTATSKFVVGMCTCLFVCGGGVP